MATEKEILATDLAVDGIQAWGRLYDTISSKLEFDMVYPDGKVAASPHVPTPLADGSSGPPDQKGGVRWR